MSTHAIRAAALLLPLLGSACTAPRGTAPVASPSSASASPTLPLVADEHLADPSAHVFDGRLYVYTSHDIEGPPLADVPPFTGSQGNAFKMRDYRVIELDRADGTPTVHRDVLALEDVPWASRQLWAPDVARKLGRYYLYFPAKDHAGAFRIGVAVSTSPTGPFTAQPQPIAGSFSIDPAAFTDADGRSYLYFGGLSGGQLQQQIDGRYDPEAAKEDPTAPDALAPTPKVARLSEDMLGLAEPPRDVLIVDADGQPLRGAHRDRFFEAAWLHTYQGRYYLSWSTGPTHFIAYATSDSPYGPFTLRGHVLNPVQGWTTHHSIVEHEGRWWLFYADAKRSGKTWLRDVKVAPLQHDADGRIRTIDPR